jgi:uncharacterized alpha-E superfamily protein
VNTVTVTIARSAAHTVRNVTRRFVWAVLMNVPHAMSLSAATALQNAKTVKKHSVWIV